jgi:hypothetical protein
MKDVFGAFRKRVHRFANGGRILLMLWAITPRAKFAA